MPANQPLRVIRQMTEVALTDLSERFELPYARVGRPSVPPEKLLRAPLLQILYSMRSEWLLVEQLQYNLVFRWFVGLGMDEPVWTPPTFTKHRERPLAGDVAQAFFAAVTAQAQEARLLSDEHFTVDGTLLEAAASGIAEREVAFTQVAALPPRAKTVGATRALINGPSSTRPGRRVPRPTRPPRRSTARLMAARRGIPATR